MKMAQNSYIKNLAKLSNPPLVGTIDYKQWAEQSNFHAFLLDIENDEIPVNMWYPETYFCSVFLPLNLLKGDYIDRMIDWSFNGNNSWGYNYTFGKQGKPTHIHLSPPLASATPSFLEKSTPIVFSRFFEGKKESKSYIEINQFLTHLHSLHWDEGTNSFCRLDTNGDVEQAIRIYHEKEEKLITIKRDIVDFHNFISKTVLIRFFDRMVFTDRKTFMGWHNLKHSVHKNSKNEIYYKMGVEGEISKDFVGSFIRGFQIIRNLRPRKEMIAILSGKYLGPQEFVKFIASDWKHNTIAEVSCDPKQLGNYFVKSDMPYEISPVFFRPDVLLKYKADPDKYTISNRQIHCRGTWGLQTYDINKAGQVHTYLKYLGQLPYSEQLYWKSFNEKPIGSISARAYKTDFEGRWDLDYDPISGLKDTLHKIQKENVGLWNCSDEELFNRLHYPVTNAEKEWTDEIHALDKLVVEGFSYDYLKSLAVDLGCFNEKHGTIKILRSICENTGINKQETDIRISPLEEIRHLRTKFSGHRSGQETIAIKKRLIKEHGSLKEHFRDLLKRADFAIQALNNSDFLKKESNKKTLKVPVAGD
jgi:hypothetical protein